MIEATHPIYDVVQIINSKGCLTLDGSCFTNDLHPDQQAAIERHIQSCSTCAQHQLMLAKAAKRIQSAKPQISVSPKDLITARQTVLRELVVRRIQNFPSDFKPRIKTKWFLSRNFWLSILIGVVTAILAATTTILLY